MRIYEFAHFAWNQGSRYVGALKDLAQVRIAFPLVNTVGLIWVKCGPVFGPLVIPTAIASIAYLGNRLFKMGALTPYNSKVFALFLQVVGIGLITAASLSLVGFMGALTEHMPASFLAGATLATWSFS